MTPPFVIPPIIVFDNNIKSSSVGKNTITTAANNPPQSPVYCMEVRTLFKPGPTDMFFSEEAKIRDRKYSFHTFIKLKMPTVTIPCVPKAA